MSISIRYSYDINDDFPYSYRCGLLCIQFKNKQRDYRVNFVVVNAQIATSPVVRGVDFTSGPTYVTIASADGKASIITGQLSRPSEQHPFMIGLIRDVEYHIFSPNSKISNVILEYQKHPRITVYAKNIMHLWTNPASALGYNPVAALQAPLQQTQAPLQLEAPSQLQQLHQLQRPQLRQSQRKKQKLDTSGLDLLVSVI